MLAIRDENVVNAAQAARQAQAKGQLGAKTPGARFPKTPAKIPLNDENSMAGRTALKAKGTVNQSVKQQQNLVTPSETQFRAPLGNKTTNAKTKTGQVGVKDIVKEFEKTQQSKPTTVKKPRQKSPTIDPLKVSVHDDNNKNSDELDVEYAPPKPKELPYESDVFPDGGLTFEGLKKDNLLRGYYNHFHNPIGKDGMRLQDRKHEERMQTALREHDDAILRDIDAMDWSVADVPGANKLVQKKTAPTTNRTALQSKKTGHGSADNYPATINSKRAASVLSMGNSSTIRQKKAAGESAPALAPRPTPARRPMSALLPGKKTKNKDPAATKNPAADSAVGEAASRSTIGYNKGRSASTMLNKRTPGSAAGQENVRPRPTSSVSTATVKQERLAAAQPANEQDQQDLQRLQFLSIFDEPEVGDDDFGSVPQFDDDLDGEFELKLA